jgi:hypothetical protein
MPIRYPSSGGGGSGASGLTLSEDGTTLSFSGETLAHGADFSDAGVTSIETLSMPQATSLIGMLVVSGNQIATTDFSALANIGGTGLNLASNHIVAPGFTALMSIEGPDTVVDLRYNLIATASFPALTSLAGALFLSSNSIVNASFPALTSLTGYLALDYNNMTTASKDAFYNALAATLTEGGGVIDTSANAGFPSGASSAARFYLGNTLGISISA